MTTQNRQEIARRKQLGALEYLADFAFVVAFLFLNAVAIYGQFTDYFVRNDYVKFGTRYPGIQVVYDYPAKFIWSRVPEVGRGGERRDLIVQSKWFHVLRFELITFCVSLIFAVAIYVSGRILRAVFRTLR